MSPEDQRVWEEDAETEYAEAHAQARPAPHGPADAEKVSQDVGEVERARVARYAEAIHRRHCGRDHESERVLVAVHGTEASAVMAIANEESATLVAENERLRAKVEQETAHWQEMGREADREMLRAESAEAEVKRLRVRLAKVEALHVVADNAIPPDAPDWCVACGRTWPCPTIAALADAPTEQTKGGE